MNEEPTNKIGKAHLLKLIRDLETGNSTLNEFVDALEAYIAMNEEEPKTTLRELYNEMLELDTVIGRVSAGELVAGSAKTCALIGEGVDKVLKILEQAATQGSAE